MQPMRIAEELASRGIDLVGGGVESRAPGRRLSSSAETNFVTDASVGVANGFDIAALRPSNDYARPDRRADGGAQIWTAAVALSLSLHAAGLIAVLVWPKPSPAPSDSTPIEIVVEVAPPDASSPLKFERTPVPEEAPPTPPVVTPAAPASVVEQGVPAIAVPAPPLAPTPFEPPPVVDQTAPEAVTPVPSPAPSAAHPSSTVERPLATEQATPEIVMPVPPPAPLATPTPVADEPPPIAEQQTPAIVTPVPPSALVTESAPGLVAPPPIAERAAPEVLTLTPPLAPLVAPPPSPIAPPPVAEQPVPARVTPTPPSPSSARPLAPPIVAPVHAHASAAVQQPKPRAEPPRKTEAHASIQAGPAESKTMKPVPGAARASLPAVSGAEISEYQGAVIARLSAAKRYPEAARDRGPRGMAVVRFTIDASGQVVGVSLAQSAGDAILDGEALATVRRASPFPPPPAGAPRVFSAPLSFKVR
jgi:periplasmic protein TonB